MHRSILAIAASTALILSGPAYAGQRGHGGGKPATSPSSGHGPSTTHGNSGVTTHGQSGSHGGASTHGSGTTHGASGTTHGSGGGKTHTSGGGNTKHATTISSDSAGLKTTTTDTKTASASTSDTVTLTPVQQKLQKNTNLADKLASRLPAGTDLMKASEGFKNLGQFVAAVNVSNNVGVKFTDLKTRMVDDGMSLGQALQDVKKTTNFKTEVQRAETEADAMIKSTTTTTSTATTAATTSSTTKKSSKTKTTTKSPSTPETR